MTMEGNLAVPIKGLVDDKGMLVSADPMLLRLHLRAGGEDGGMLAIPQLSELCDATQRLGMSMSRSILAADDSVNIRMWVDSKLQGDDVELSISDWIETEIDEVSMLQSQSRVRDFEKFENKPSLQLDSALRVMVCSLPDVGLDIQNVIGKPITAIFELKEDKTQTLPLLEAVAERQPFTRQLVGLRGSKDGKIYSLSGVPVFEKDAGFAGYVCRCENSEAEVKAATTAPKKTGPKLLDTSLFGTQLGPALRQPLGRIIANADTIGGKLEGPIRSDYANYANDIAAAARHLVSLVDDLSDLEAIEKEGFSAAKDEIDLGDLGRRASGLLAVKASDHQILIDVPAKDASVPAIGEFRRVLQILVNLIGNAIRYSPDGSNIWVRTQTEGSRAFISVTDEGPGISVEQQASVFEKFERLGRSGDGGSGLGLYISKRLALAMGGDLHVVSEVGRGARFTLELPIVHK